MIEIMQVDLPYRLVRNSIQTSFPVFYNTELEEETQQKVGTLFVKTPKMCLACAELYRFGSSAALPGILCDVDFQKASYWHAQALSLLGIDNWTESFDLNFLSEDYKKALREFLRQEMVTLNLQHDDERIEAAWNAQQLNLLAGDGQ